MDPFLEGIKIKKRKLRPCNRCDEKVKMQDGEIYCKDCHKKVQKINDPELFKVNFTGDGSG